MSHLSKNQLFGVFSCAAGVITAVAVYVQPAGPGAPAWVAYSACLAFVIAGLVILAKESASGGLYRWAAALLLVAVAIPPNWVAFGPGTRICSGSVGLFDFSGPGISCRLAFGIGGACMAAVAVWAIRMAWASENAG